MQSLTWPVHGSVGEERGRGEKIGFYHSGSCHMDANMWRRRRAAVSPQWLFCTSSLNLLAHFIQVTALRCCGWIVICGLWPTAQIDLQHTMLRVVQDNIRTMLTSCVTSNQERSPWRTRKGQRPCGIWIWSSSRRCWKGSFWRDLGPTRVPGSKCPCNTQSRCHKGMHSKPCKHCRSRQKQKLAMLKITTRGHLSPEKKKVTSGSKGGHFFFRTW